MPQIVQGFHGTSKNVAEFIANNGASYFHISQNEYDWLGDGAYFWENNLKRAMDWAKKHFKANAAVKQTALKHNRDRAVIEYLIEQYRVRGTAIRCVRSSFNEGKPIFPMSAIYRQAHIQIAVRDTSLITNLRIHTP